MGNGQIKPSERKTFRGLILTGGTLVGLLFCSIKLAEVLARSKTTLSHFSRVELCSLCGMEQSYREIGLLDHYPLRETRRFDTEISHILRTGKRKECGHCFYCVYERMIHLSTHATSVLTFRESNKGYDSDIFTNRKYVTSINAIAKDNPEAAQLIWSRTVRHVFNSNSVPLIEIRCALKERNEAELTQFLRTNRYFRPARPNPERIFYSASGF